MRSLLLGSLVMTWASVASAEDPSACARTCAKTLKQFEAQCKKDTGKDADGQKGCDMVLKRFQVECAKKCANGGKREKPANTNSF
jgi:hypothetical protein